MRLATIWIGTCLIVGCPACESKNKGHIIEYQSVKPEEDVVVNPIQSRQKRSTTRVAVKPVQYGVIKFNAFNHTKSTYAYLYGLVIDSVDRPVSHCGIFNDENGQNISITDGSGRFIKRIRKKPYTIYAAANNVNVSSRIVEYFPFTGEINANVGDSIILIIRLKSKTKRHTVPPIDNFTEGEERE